MDRLSSIAALVLGSFLAACAADNDPSADPNAAGAPTSEDELRKASLADVYDCSLEDSNNVTDPTVPEMMTIAPKTAAVAEMDVLHVTGRVKKSYGYDGKWGAHEPTLNAAITRSGAKIIVTTPKNVITIDTAAKGTGTWGKPGLATKVTDNAKTFEMRCTGFSRKEWLENNSTSTNEPDGTYLEVKDTPATLRTVLGDALKDINAHAKAGKVTLKDTSGIYEQRFVSTGSISGYVVWAAEEVEDVEDEGHQAFHVIGFDAAGKELFREFDWIP